VRVPLRWLSEYVDFDASVEELTRRLTHAGLEVAAIERFGTDWQGIVIGEIVEVRDHPQADRLRIAQVDCGSSVKLSVTGAPNVRAGQRGLKVAVAKPGARLYSGHASAKEIFTVEPAQVRGVASEVVLCSEKELGISDDHTGILLLDSNASVGRPLTELLGDTVLELELTPNLARCLSVIGVAREISALLNGRALKIGAPQCRAAGPSIDERAEVEIADEKLCARYTAMLIEGVQNGPSPTWLRWRLQLAGMRPINVLVDITNYAMLEWGQPLHAFDYDALCARARDGLPRITVRRARNGEKITALDGVERPLNDESLVIADERGPIAIAGVMGGRETEVSEKTRAVLLESACFDRTSIRRTAQQLKLHSEASLRFGRGIPAELALRAARRAADLMRQHARGTVAQGVVDAYPHKQPTMEISLEPQEVKRLLGLSLDKRRITSALRALDFTVEREGRALRVTVPWHRLDVEIPADLIEEIARVIGYAQLPETLIAEPPPSHRPQVDLPLEEGVRDLLVGAGLTEVITYSLTDPTADAKLYPAGEVLHEEYLGLTNPLSSERAYLKRSLMAQLLATVAENQRHRERVAIFEIGHVYLPRSDATDGLPDEPRRLALALAGPRRPPAWNEPSVEVDFFDLKGIIDELAQRLGLCGSFSPIARWPFHPGRAAELRIDGVSLGYLGEVHPEVGERFELRGRTMLAELDLEMLLAKSAVGANGRSALRRYQPAPRFPAIQQDLAIVLDERIPASRIEALIRQAGQPLLSAIHLFDVYRGDQIPAGQRSLAYSLQYRAPDRTLTDQEVQAVQAKIQAALAQELGAKVRGAES
jgi:phenylalanyl-tRNA synthetase beta chain